MAPGIFILLFGTLILVGLVTSIVGIVGLAQKKKRAWIWLVVGLVVTFVPAVVAVLWTLVALLGTR